MWSFSNCFGKTKGRDEESYSDDYTCQKTIDNFVKYVNHCSSQGEIHFEQVIWVRIDGFCATVSDQKMFIFNSNKMLLSQWIVIIVFWSDFHSTAYPLLSLLLMPFILWKFTLKLVVSESGVFSPLLFFKLFLSCLKINGQQ